MVVVLIAGCCLTNDIGLASALVCNPGLCGCLALTISKNLDLLRLDVEVAHDTICCAKIYSNNTFIIRMVYHWFFVRFLFIIVNSFIITQLHLI